MTIEGLRRQYFMHDLPGGRRLPLALRFAAPVLILALTWTAIDGKAALSALAGASPWWILAGLALMQVQILLSAERWRFTASRLGQVLPRRLAYREYYLTTLVNQVVPGGVAGDAVRAARNRVLDAEGKARWGVAVRAVVLERTAGQIAFVSVTAAGLLAWPFLVGRQAPAQSGELLLAAFGFAAALMALAAALARFGPARLRAFLRSFAPDLRGAYIERWAWLVQGAVSVAIVSTYIAIFAVAAHAVGTPVPLAGLVTVVPLALLTMLVPISAGGWGLREAAAAALWPLLALPASAGVAAAILYGLISLAGALPGLLVLLGTRTGTDRPARTPAPVSLRSPAAHRYRRKPRPLPPHRE